MQFTPSRLILWVADPATLARWYTATFGWPVTVDESADGWIELDAGGFTVALHAGRDHAVPHWPKLQLRVADVAQAVAALTAKGVAMGPIQEWKGLAWSEGEDPEGHVFQVSSR